MTDLDVFLLLAVLAGGMAVVVAAGYLAPR
jgi:hypothetical protein